MNISTLNASGESYFACSSDDMILGPGECIDKAPGLNSLHPPFSPRLAAYRWGSRGREAEVNSQRSSGRKSACMNMYVLINLFCFDQPLTIYQPWACISVWMLKVFPACVVMLRRVPQPIIFVSWINSAALSALWMSGTMAVAMAMPHCNILLQLSCPLMLAAASRLQKK